MNLQNLPEIVLEKIFSYLTYNQVAENRVVSRRFNEIGMELLNRGYYMVERFHKRSLKAVKSELPRRESERKTHPLARRCESLVAIETRLSMLSMTFSKYIETKQCCFIPGKVLDELLRVLKYVNTATSPPYDLLQELRDISSMAMEHFDEVIVPQLKEKLSKSSTSLPDAVGVRRCKSTLTVMSFKELISVFRQNATQNKPNQDDVTSPSVSSNQVSKKNLRNQRIIKRLTNQVTVQRRQIRSLHRIMQNWEEKFKDLSSEVRSLSGRSASETFSLPAVRSVGSSVGPDVYPLPTKRRRKN